MRFHETQSPGLRRRPRNLINAGFTLVEIMVVVLIIGLLAAIGFKGIPWAVASAKAVSLKALVKDIAQKAETYDSLFNKTTVTELPGSASTVLPTADTTTSDLTYDQVTAWDLLLAKELITDKPTLGLGTNPPAAQLIFNPAIVDYNRSTMQFFAGAAATRTNYTTLGYNRLETITANSTLDPATAKGANFYLKSATVPLPTGATVWVLVVEGLTPLQASVCATWFNEDDVNNRTGQSQSLGRVAYTTPDPVTNKVTAYIYVKHRY